MGVLPEHIKGENHERIIDSDCESFGGRTR